MHSWHSSCCSGDLEDHLVYAVGNNAATLLLRLHVHLYKRKTSFYYDRYLTSLTFFCPASHKHQDRCLQVSSGGDGESESSPCCLGPTRAGKGDSAWKCHLCPLGAADGFLPVSPIPFLWVHRISSLSFLTFPGQLRAAACPLSSYPDGKPYWFEFWVGL